jgi:hypothetical protein
LPYRVVLVYFFDYVIDEVNNRYDHFSHFFNLPCFQIFSEIPLDAIVVGVYNLDRGVVASPHQIAILNITSTNHASRNVLSTPYCQRGSGSDGEKAKKYKREFHGEDGVDVWVEKKANRHRRVSA